MGQAPPLDELAARKRLIQAKMELHRAEMALYYQQTIAPIQMVRSGLSTITTHPLTRIVLMSGLGFFLVRGRFRLTRKAAALVIGLALPQLRTFLVNRTLGWGIDKLRAWFVTSE